MGSGFWTRESLCWVVWAWACVLFVCVCVCVYRKGDQGHCHLHKLCAGGYARATQGLRKGYAYSNRQLKGMSDEATFVGLYIYLHEVALETRAMRLRARGLRQQIFEFAARLRRAQRAQSAHTAPKSRQHPMQRPLLLARRGRRRGRVGEHTSPVGEHHLRERRARAKERLSV